MKSNGQGKPRIANFSGGAKNSMSLAQLTDWCDARFGKHVVASDAKPRPFDIPWMVLDSTLAEKTWDWSPKILLPQGAGRNREARGAESELAGDFPIQLITSLI